jgi:hypothetical protein
MTATCASRQALVRHAMHCQKSSLSSRGDFIFYTLIF